jgi:hypothetical protein
MEVAALQIVLLPLGYYFLESIPFIHPCSPYNEPVA